MKKCIIGVMIFLFSVIFCGCSVFGNKSRDDRSFMVSAVGFEADNELVTLYAEAVIINSELSETEPKAAVLEGTGKSISKALENIEASLAKPMSFSHCGVIVIGRQMTDRYFREICEYCFKENSITLSAYMISADSIRELLSENPESSVAVGYDIMGIIEKSGINGNRYFEIEGLREKGENTFILPHFVRRDGRITADGASLLHDGVLTDIVYKLGMKGESE